MNRAMHVVMAGILSGVAACASGQVSLLSQDRSIALLTAADGVTQSASANNFAPFAASVARHVVVQDPFGPVDTGGGLNISCHFEGGIDLTATMSGWSIAETGVLAAPVTAEVNLDLAFAIDQPMQIWAMRNGLGSSASVDEVVEISLRRLDSQRRSLINDSDTTIGSMAEHTVELPAGEYEFRFHALLESTGEVAQRNVLLQVRFGEVPCVADMNADGGIDGTDVNAFFEVWETGEVAGDVNRDGGVDGMDVQYFLEHWERGC
ncbi:MAG: hypothetical protein NTV94_13945 [Planctomycetota bacterium]|nr:hypothetical protein [Planctomycetota bacterium]